MRTSDSSVLSQVADDDVYAIFRGYMRFGKQSLCCEGPYPSIDAN